MKVQTILFPEGSNREEALRISAALQTPEKCVVFHGSDPKIKSKASKANKAGQLVLIVTEEE
jgi:hypothetical protein